MPDMQIAIAGKKSETKNYTAYVEKCGFTPLVTLNTGDIAHCQGLILPGGGDITPAFFGEKNHGSKNIDTELDILQLQSFDYCLRNRIPVLGICKGIQLINVGLGGSIYQHFPSAERHCCLSGDQYHNTTILKDSFLYPLYGSHMPVNSAHHQALKELGSGLKAIQWCPEDSCIEALCHESLPLIGVQWHPERLDENRAKTSGEALFSYFASLVQAYA